MNPNPVTGSRIRLLRNERGETQKEMAIHFSDFMGRPTTLSEMAISCWESGRKMPPVDTFMWLQRYFGVSLDYLAGLTDDRDIGGNSKVAKGKDIKKGMEIPLREMSQHDGEPVYVVFPPSTQKNQWGIVDYPNRVIWLANSKLSITEKCKYYLYTVPEEVTIRSLAHHLINMNDLLKKERVWIESLSPDPYIKGQMTGWYKHNPTKEYLVNEIGQTLSYEGLGVTYNAIEFKSTKKRYAKDDSKKEG